MRANVPDARGEVCPEEEGKVDESPRVQAERGSHLGARDEQEGFVPARDVADERRSVDEDVLDMGERGGGDEHYGRNNR